MEFRNSLRRPVCFLFLPLAAATGSTVPAVAALSPATVKIALHVTSAPEKAALICTTARPEVPCSEYLTEGDIGIAYVVYLVTAQSDSLGVLGLSCGIDYDPAPGSGLDVFEWSFCASGLEFPGSGENGPWPAAGSGNRMTWLDCQRNNKIPPDGVHAVWGAFYLYAYGADDLQVVPNQYTSGPELQIVTCLGGEVDLPPWLSAGRAAFSPGASSPGYNPCLSEGDCRIVRDRIDFGIVPLGKYADRSFVVTNLITPPGGLDLEGEVVLDGAGDFRILEGGGPYRLAAGEKRTVTVRYAPAAVGRATGQVETGCRPVRLQGEGGTPSGETPKVALHVQAPEGAGCDEAPAVPCSQYATRSDTGVSRFVYLVVGKGDPVRGVSALSCGIDYDAAPQRGVDVLSWTSCGDGLQFLMEGPHGEWPAAGGGIRMTWNSCQETVLDPDGVHAVAGVFYVHAYGDDDLSVIPNGGLVSGPELAVGTCSGTVLLSPETDAGAVVFSAGSARPGRNPCAAAAGIEASDVRLVPESLDAAAGARWMTAHVELPPGVDPGRVDPETVRLQGSIPADPGFPWDPGDDFNGNGIPDLIFKFDRDSFVESIPPGLDVVEAVVTGEVAGAGSFRASAPLRVVRPRMTAPNGGESYPAGTTQALVWETPEGWMGTGTASLSYALDGGASWIPITQAVGVGTAAWSVPAELLGSVRIRVEVRDVFGLLGWDETDGPVTVTGATGEGPARTALLANLPNPFSAATRIPYQLADGARVRMTVFDVQGQRIRLLVDGPVPAGSHEARWDGRDDAGNPVASGLYLVGFRAGSYQEARRILLTR